jgi:hypothetical protein
MANVNDVISAFLQLRVQKEGIVERHKQELAPVNDAMNKCKAWIQQQLQDQGLKNFSGESGIAFLQTNTSVKVQDFDALLEWIKENDAWAFLEKRVSKSVVEDFIEAHAEMPPGVSVSSEIDVHVRKS